MKTSPVIPFQPKGRMDALNLAMTIRLLEVRANSAKANRVTISPELARRIADHLRATRDALESTGGR